ncbi:unnamed protein product, partial [Meganyctiphanes norvegica]
MEELHLEVSGMGSEGLGDADGPMITLVQSSSPPLDSNAHNVHILTPQQLEGHLQSSTISECFTQSQREQQQQSLHHLGLQPQQPHRLTIQLQPQEQSSQENDANNPHCLVCNAKLGVSARGATQIFSDKVKTTHRQLRVGTVLSNIINRQLTMAYVHSYIICKKCFKLIDDIDSLEGQLVNMKQVVTNKYMRTLAVVKDQKRQSISSLPSSVLPTLSSHTQEEEEEQEINIQATTLAKDDRDFKVYMAHGEPNRGRGRRGRRGRGRGRPPGPTSILKLEVKEEEDVLVGVGLQGEHVLETNGVLEGASTASMGSRFDEIGVADGCSSSGQELPINEDGIPESETAEEDVMEVDDLHSEDEDDAQQDLSGMRLPGLSVTGGEQLSSGPEDPNGNNLIGEGYPPSTPDKYKCLYCHRKMTQLADVQAHMREFHPERLFECEICRLRFDSKGELIIHLQQHVATEERIYACDICPQSFAQPRQLREHQRQHINNKSFQCSECPKRFRSEQNLQEHFNVHSGNRPYACEICGKKFTSKHTLKTHLRTHSVRQRPHQCKTCGKTFLTSYHLADHMHLHEEKKSFICENCGKAFATQRSLDLHTLTHSGVKNFSCSICNKLFARKGEVEDHERIHTGEKPFQCEICGSTFNQRSNLQSHKRITHYQEKRYPCTQCGKAFKRKRLLVYHVMSVHTGERPYKCEQCNAGFVYPEHYKKHQRIHTGEKPFKCDVCGKKFNSRDNRNAHKFIHSDKKPYECLLCGAGFMRKPMIASHLQQHGHTHNIDAYIKVNSPSAVTNEGEEEHNEVAAAMRMKIDDDSNLEQSLDGSVQLVQQRTIREHDGGETLEVVSRPVHIIEADDLPRYIIHTTAGDRTIAGEEAMGHFIASLQGQVVEVRAEDLERYTDMSGEHMFQGAVVTTGQTAGTSGTLQQVATVNAGDIRPLHIQIEAPSREITLHTQNDNARDVRIFSDVEQDARSHTRREVGPKQQVYGVAGAVMLKGWRTQAPDPLAPGLAGTVRKVFTSREELRTISVQNIITSSEGRTV